MISCIQVGDAKKLVAEAAKAGANLRLLDDSSVTISLDEVTEIADVDALFAVLNGGRAPDFSAESLAESVRCAILCSRLTTLQAVLPDL